MKLFFYITFTVLSIQVFGQAQKANAEIEYSFYSNSFIPTLYYSNLYVNKDVAIFYENPNDRAVRGEAKDENGNIYQSMDESGKTNFLEPYYKIDRQKKEILFFDEIGANKYLVQDDYQNLDWQVGTEKKTIENFICTKATAKFRGREWIAWFTTEIPLPFGPWKLHGLPGLILEATDATKQYTWKAVKIQFKRNSIFDKDFASLIKTKNKKPVPYHQFLLNSKEYRDNVTAEMLKNDPNLKDVPVPNNGFETAFEWDK